jgi:hypothetical protein
MPKSLTVSVQDEVPEFIQLQQKGKSNLVMAHTKLALRRLSEMYMNAWQEAATGTQLPGLPFTIQSTTYQTTIRRRRISPTVYEIYTDYATKTGRSVTELLEAGHGLIDLKDGLMRGPKSRMGKKGRYNIVAFRQGVPDALRNPMPLSVYRSFSDDVKRADAQKKAGASPTGGTSSVTRPNPRGYAGWSGGPATASYTWGSRFDRNSQLDRQTKTIKKGKKTLGQYQWQSGKYAGMVRLQQSTTKSSRGGYFTFRVVSAASDPMSWIVPEQPPWPVRNAVINLMKPYAEDILREAIQADIK